MDTQVGAGTSSKSGRLGNGGVIGVTVLALIAALIGGQILMHRASTGGAANATKRSMSLSSQDFIARQRTLEESTSAAGTVPYYRTINGATYYDRLTSQGLTTATTGEQGTIYRVSDSAYYVPVAGGMWKVVRVGTDGMPVIEDFVSGPPPANAIAVTP